MPLFVANGAGFLGDSLDAPRRLAESLELDYLTLEYLAELTLSVLARARERDPGAGFAGDLVTVLRELSPALRNQSKLRIITNGGGVNPLAGGKAAGQLLAAEGMGHDPLGVVAGDDLLPRIAELQAAGVSLAHLDTGEPLSSLTAPIVSAHAYMGAQGIAQALAAGARHVVTGRVADASLTLGPAVHEFGWSWSDWNRLAGASVAGHLIECGAQSTGGYSVAAAPWDLADVGYPIAELSDDGSSIITKPVGSQGVVDRFSVIEQLVYEIGDPAHYLTPDVDCDFTSVEVRSAGGNRVQISGATGNPRPDMLKVALSYRDGFTSAATLLVWGDDCLEKARACGEILFARLAQAGHTYARTNIELLGAGEGVPGIAPPKSTGRPPEVVVRLAVHDPRREAVERFTKEFAPLITSGPAGLAGYAVGRADVRPVFAYWPALVPRELVEPKVEVRPAKEWA